MFYRIIGTIYIISEAAALAIAIIGPRQADFSRLVPSGIFLVPKE
jgi:hypothetical protein